MNSVVFSPDGHRLASGSEDGTVRLWDADTGEPIGDPLTGHTDAVTDVAFSPDGHRLASGSADRTVRLWDADTREPIGEALTGHTGPVNGVAFSPDGQRLASAGHDSTVRLWNPDAGQPLEDRPRRQGEQCALEPRRTARGPHQGPYRAVVGCRFRRAHGRPARPSRSPTPTTWCGGWR